MRLLVTLIVSDIIIIRFFTGIWVCRAETAPLLVMDVERADGRERGMIKWERPRTGSIFREEECSLLVSE
jgi:hypothetical protein